MRPGKNAPTGRCVHGVIYTVTNRVNGKQYVGQTTTSVKERWADHVLKANSKRKTRCSVLWNAIRRYGPDAFEVEAIIACDSQEELDRMEVTAIEAGNTLSPNGYNLQSGGGGGKMHYETRLKISEAIRGEKNHFYGKHHSEEARSKIGKAHRGMKRPPRSEEMCRRISESKRGEKHPLYGKHPSDETRLKRSESARGEKSHFYGKRHSEESRRKMSESHRKRHQ